MSPNSLTPSQLSGVPLRVHDLALYLRKTGWQRVHHPNQRLLVFEHGIINGTEQPLRTVLASSDDYADSPELIGNALDLLAEVQGVDVQQIARAVHAIDRDILSVRFLGPQASSGGMRLDTATTVVLQLRDLLAYAACVEEYPRPYFPRATSIGRKYTESCVFGHTFPGSFGFTIESPTGPAPFSDSNDSPPPFERRVMTRVLRGIGDLRQAILSGEPEMLVQRYEAGLNANMCELLEETLKQADDAEMEYSVLWSPEWPVPPEIQELHAVRLQPSAAAFLGAAARQLRRLEESKTRQISGRVVALQSDASASDDERTEDPEQVATILWEEQRGRKLRVRVALEHPDYILACDAHKVGQEVRVTGRLEKVGKFWTLMAPSQFEVLPPR
jgi:hypothetical protein